MRSDMRTFRANRLKADWSILAKGKRSAPAAGYVTNVGLSGMRFVSTKEFKLHDVLSVEVDDHRDTRFHASVRVVWKRTLPNGPFDYGVRFSHIALEDEFI